MDQNRPPKINYASDILVNFETKFGQFNNYVTLKTEIFAPRLSMCIFRSTLNILDISFLIFCPLFLIEFFRSG